LRIGSQSRHSARTERSAIAFAFGAGTGVRGIVICSLGRTSSRGPVYVLSRSRRRKRICCSAKKRPRLRACWATQLASGFLVGPAWWARRLPCSMKKSTW
jgi:hypothetical protein